MSKNGIDHKDVPEHRLINARKIAVNSSVHDYRKAEKPQLPKQDDNMWKSIKKFALKRLLPFVKEVADADIDVELDNGVLHVMVRVSVLGELVYARKIVRNL